MKKIIILLFSITLVFAVPGLTGCISKSTAKDTTSNTDSLYAFVPQDYGMVLNNVADVAVDSKNNIFAIVRGEIPILVFNAEGKFLYSWGKGMIAGPHGIYIDSLDNVFCVDSKDHVVMKFTTDGKLLMTLGTRGLASNSGSIKGNFKTVKMGAGPFNVPTKVATSRSGDIFVSDGYGNARDRKSVV
jgi:hypothetical protein